MESGGGRATLACCVRRSSLEALRAGGSPAGDSLLRHMTGRSAGLALALRAARGARPVARRRPVAARTRSLYRDGAFAIGNAAGEAHPIVGEGIAMAMRSAALLCGPLSAALKSGDSSPRGCACLHARVVARLRPACKPRAFSRASPCSRRFAEAFLRSAPGLLTAAAAISGKASNLLGLRTEETDEIISNRSHHCCVGARRACSPQTGERGSLPPGTSQDGGRPRTAPSRASSILPGERSGVPAKAKCEELSGSLREDCLKQEREAGVGGTATESGARERRRHPR